MVSSVKPYQPLTCSQAFYDFPSSPASPSQNSPFYFWPSRSSVTAMACGAVRCGCVAVKRHSEPALVPTHARNNGIDEDSGSLVPEIHCRHNRGVEGFGLRHCDLTSRAINQNLLNPILTPKVSNPVSLSVEARLLFWYPVRVCW